MFDIEPFVLVLTGTPPDYPEYYAQYPMCDHLLADTACDGAVSNSDIDSFVECLTGGCAPCAGDMVLILAGEFEMGDSFGEGYSDELPVHAIYISSYYMDVYEVTNAQYCAYLNSAYGQGLIHVSGGVVYKAGGTSYAYCDTTDQLVVQPDHVERQHLRNHVGQGGSSDGQGELVRGGGVQQLAE